MLLLPKYLKSSHRAGTYFTHVSQKGFNLRCHFGKASVEKKKDNYKRVNALQILEVMGAYESTLCHCNLFSWYLKIRSERVSAWPKAYIKILSDVC